VLGGPLRPHQHGVQGFRLLSTHPFGVTIRHRLLSMKPGTPLVSHQHGMADWKPERSVQIQGRNVYLCTVPARADGVWDFRDGEDNTCW
jgi:hypothetical protein